MKYNSIFIVFLVFIALTSCATKKDIWYLQDVQDYDGTIVNYSTTTIQPNDILRITVGTLVEEAASAFNMSPQNQAGGANIELMQLQGYLVTTGNTIDFPQIGTISTFNKTVLQLQEDIKNLLEEKALLKDPTVSVRILNAKVTILGEVNAPGTYTFAEENITLLQALGTAGDLTINGRREDVKIIREMGENRQVTTVDLTTAKFFDSEFYQIKPNDVIVVNQNGPRVKSAGFITNIGGLISLASILFTTIVLLTR